MLTPYSSNPPNSGGSNAIHSICAKTAAPDTRVGPGPIRSGGTGNDHFGVHVFTDLGTPSSPIFVDAILRDLPLTMYAKMNDPGSAANANTPFLTFDTTACSSAGPPVGNPTQTTGIDLVGIVRTGPDAVQAVIPSPPGSSSPLGLPSLDTAPYGTNITMADDDQSGLGTAIMTKLKLPSSLAVYRPQLSTCADGVTDKASLVSCQTQKLWTRDQSYKVTGRFRSTLKSLGPLTATVLLRSHPTTFPDGAVCAGKPQCDRRIDAQLDNIPGQVSVNATLTNNERTHTGHVLATLSNDAPNPNLADAFKTLKATIFDGLQPKAADQLGNAVPSEAIRLTNVGTSLTTDVAFQQAESLPANPRSGNGSCPSGAASCPAGTCPAGMPAEQSPELSYARVDLDVNHTGTLTALLRQDWDSGLHTQITADKAVSGTLDIKTSHIQQLSHGVIPPQVVLLGGASEIDLCMDMDLPMRFQINHSKDARLAMDKLQGETWSADTGGDVEFHLGEKVRGSGAPGWDWDTDSQWTWQTGVFMRYEYAHFDPQGYGVWYFPHTTVDTPKGGAFSGNKSVAFIPTWTYPTTSPVLTRDDFFSHDSVHNDIVQGQNVAAVGDGDSPATGCCVLTNGRTRFMMDPIWDGAVRHDMWCRDSDACGYAALPGRPGRAFYSGFWSSGHLASTANGVTLGALQNLNVGATGWVSGSMKIADGLFDGSPDPESDDYMDPEKTQLFKKGTSQMLQGPDGTRYRIFAGPAINDGDCHPDGTDQVTVPLTSLGYYRCTVITLDAEYGNGVTRWRRTLDNLGLSCGNGTACRLDAQMRLLATGQLEVKYKVASTDDDFTNPVDFKMDAGNAANNSAAGLTLAPADASAWHQYRFDPSGFGALDASTTQSTVLDAPADSVVTLAAPATAAGPRQHGYTYDSKTIAVWYFGDGSSKQVSVSGGQAAAVAHTYHAPGDHPGMLVYYRQAEYLFSPTHSKQWVPFAATSVKVHVS